MLLWKEPDVQMMEIRQWFLLIFQLEIIWVAQRPSSAKKKFSACRNRNRALSITSKIYLFLLSNTLSSPITKGVSTNKHTSDCVLPQIRRSYHHLPFEEESVGKRINLSKITSKTSVGSIHVEVYSIPEPYGI